MDVSTPAGNIVKYTHEKSGLEQEVSEFSNRLIGLVLGDPRLELPDDRMVGVELHGLLASHVGRHCEGLASRTMNVRDTLTGRISESLGLHDTLHVG